MNVFLKLFKAIANLFKPLAQKAVQDFFSKITPDIAKVTTDAVQAVMALGLQDVAARDAAVAQLVADAKQTGVDLKDFAKNELNALIELFYVGYKTK